MLTEYIRGAMHEARYELMEDGRFFATIPPYEGLWADGETLEATREQLQSVLEDWILIKARHGDRFPVIGGADINPQPAYAETDRSWRRCCLTAASWMRSFTSRLPKMAGSNLVATIVFTMSA